MIKQETFSISIKKDVVQKVTTAVKNVKQNHTERNLEIIVK